MFFSPVQCPFHLSVLHLGRTFVYKSIEEEARTEYSAAFMEFALRLVCILLPGDLGPPQNRILSLDL